MSGPTNVDFLKAVFGLEWERASVASFSGDPEKAPRSAWASHAAGIVQAGLVETANNYFALSLSRDARHRRNSEFDGLYVIGVDDVGVKVDGLKLRGLMGPPAFGWETSPGNEQWFYPLSSPVTDIEEAKGLLRMFQSDARDVVRWMRLPVGWNGKAGVQRSVRVTEVNAGAEWSPRMVKAIMSGEDIRVPAKLDPFAVSATVPPRANGVSDLEGYILAGAIPDGERDNGLMAFHGHAAGAWRRGWCSEVEALAFLGRVNVRLTGGADKDFAGKWERVTDLEGLVRVEDAGAHEKTDDGLALELFARPRQRAAEDFAGAPVAEGEDSLAGNAGLVLERKMLGQLVFVQRDEKWLDLRSGELMGDPTLNKLWTAHTDLVPGLTGWIGKKAAPVSVWLGRHPGVTAVARRVSRVGEGVFRDTSTGREVNVAAPWPRVPSGAGSVDIRPWLRMLVNVSGGPGKGAGNEVAGLLADWLAFLVGNIGEKPGWHVMLRGVPGVGKDEVLVPVERWLGVHAQEVSMGVLTGSFNEFAAARLVRLDEAITTEREGAGVYSEIKRYTSTNNDDIPVNGKYSRKTTAKDLSGWWITSNDRVPLPLSEADRRFLVSETVGVRDVSAGRVAGWAKWAEVARTDAGVTGVVGWLGRRWAGMDEGRRARVRAGTAPMTLAKTAVAREAEDWLVSAVRVAIDPAGSSGWGPAMSVGDMVNSLGLRGAHGLSRSQEANVTAKRIVMALKDLGCRQLKGGRPIGQSGSGLKRLWCLRPGMFETMEGMGDAALLGLAKAPTHSGFGNVGDPFAVDE